MTSSSVDNDSGAEEATINGDANKYTQARKKGENGSATGSRIVELLQEEREGAFTPQPVGNGTTQYKLVGGRESPSEDGSLDVLPRRAGSPIDSLLSVPDDSPSIQVRKPDYCMRRSHSSLGFSPFVTGWKQCITIGCITAWS